MLLQVEGLTGSEQIGLELPVGSGLDGGIQRFFFVGYRLLQQGFFENILIGGSLLPAELIAQEHRAAFLQKIEDGIGVL